MNLSDRIRGFVLRVAVPVSILAGPAAASGQEGTLDGRVTDIDLDPLAGVSVQLPELDRGALTDSRGLYRIENLPAGSHTIITRVIGFRPDTASVTIAAGEMASRNFALIESALALRGLVVTGQAGQAEAYNRQRSSANIRNVVSSEHIERFPDSNVPDVLRRMPGVAAQPDRGETGLIFLRGLEPGLTTVTLDGQRVPSTTSTGRGTSLSGVPAEMLESVEVIKAITPDMDADAVAGSINLRARRPTVAQFDGRLEGGAHTLADGGTGRAGLSYANRFGPIGLVLGGDYSRQGRATENTQYRWTNNAEGNPATSSLDRLRIQSYPIDRTRYSLNGNLDYEFGGNSFVYLRGLLSRYDTREERHRLTFRLDSGDRTSATDVEDGRVERQGREYLRQRNIYNLTLGGEHGFTGATLDYSISGSQADRVEPYRDYLEFRQSGVGMRGLAEDRLFPSVEVTNGKDPHDLSDFGLQYYEQRRDRMQDRDLAGLVNLEVPFTLGDLRFGASYRTKNKDRDFDRIRFNDIDGSFFMSEMGTAGDHRTVTSRGYRLGPVVDWGRGREFVSSNGGNLADGVNRTREESDSEDFTASENVGAAYAMSTFELGDLTLLGGVRYERTDTRYDGKRLLFDEEGDYVETLPAQASGGYSDFFPMAHLRFQVDDATNIRLAYTSTIGRPNFIALAPNEFINREDEFIRRGNPELASARSHNLDLLAERYFQSVGVFSGGLFLKQISDFAFTSRTRLTEGEFAGFDLIQPQSGDRATVYGLELAWQQRLAFLPGALNGLGVFANYTYSGSRTELGDDNDRNLPLPEQVPHIGNLALSYDRGGFSGLLSVNYQGDYYQRIGATQMEDRLLRRRRQIDLAANQQLSPNVRAFVQLNNLNNEPYMRYFGNVDFPDENEFEGRWGTLGLRFNF